MLYFERQYNSIIEQQILKEARMASLLQELLYRRDALNKKLTRLKNLQQLMQTPNKSLDGEIHMTQLRLDEVTRSIDAYNKR